MVLLTFKKRQRVDDYWPEWLRGAVVSIKDLVSEGFAIHRLIIGLLVSAFVARPGSSSCLAGTICLVGSHIFLGGKDLPEVIDSQLFVGMVLPATS